jgi:spoIIIJ-associated protein
MTHLEVSAKTVEEAIQSALEQLGVSREEVEIAVLEEGKSGVFSLGAEEARVRVRLLRPAEEVDIAGIAQEILERLLELLDLKASVVLRKDTDEESSGVRGPVFIDIQGDDLGILIGRGGQTLAALQYLVRTIISHRLELKVPLVIDVEGYRERRIESLQNLAQRIADQVVSQKELSMMRPMTAYERRIIHIELADDPDVTTHSIGTGDGRRVVIEPKKS